MGHITHESLLSFIDKLSVWMFEEMSSLAVLIDFFDRTKVSH